MNTTLHLIRHAEVEARYQGVFGGVIDMDLSPEGERQAAALAKYLRAHTFDAIFSSPMKRVQQTLTPVRQEHRPPPVVMPGLHEVDFGVWTGLTFAEVKARFGRDAHEWLHQLDAGGIPQAETTPGLKARIQDCLDEILADNRGRTVAVFCTAA
jgi:broad specificity phosphatase PhoE